MSNDNTLEKDYETRIRTLIGHAWDSEITWPEVVAWLENFRGSSLSQDRERLYAIFSLTRFMYFGKRLIREMLRSLYRDHFESPLLQRIRRNLRDTKDTALIRRMYQQELKSTRFIGVGNPSESGAHLLYYFRQVNYLSKDLFADLSGSFYPKVNRNTNEILQQTRDPSVNRYIFFDDLVGSGTQIAQYLTDYFSSIRKTNPNVELRHMSLFSTTAGLKKMNEPTLFNGNSMCLFELDETYKAFGAQSRYFAGAPGWFQLGDLHTMATAYGGQLFPEGPTGYKDGQLLLAFSHNTPDNVPPIFWDEGYLTPWKPVFRRYGKIY
jgi:hypothetical protein